MRPHLIPPRIMFMGYIDSVFGHYVLCTNQPNHTLDWLLWLWESLIKRQFDICNLDAAWFLVIREKDRVTITKNKTMH